MTNATVFILLLDALTGFDSVVKEAIQELLITESLSQATTADIRKCDPRSIEAIMQVVEHNKRKDSTQTNEEIDQINEKSLSDLNKSIENELQNFIDNDKDFYTEEVNNSVNSIVVEKPSFLVPLVAIFESLWDVTAQTCAGTVLAARWVLTAGACLDLLPQLYAVDRAKSNHRNHSRYTIVANASDPLIDGTAHDVIETIIKYPVRGDDDDEGKLSQHLKIVEDPSIALMKINSSVGMAPLRVMDREVVDGVVTVYGWSLRRNSTGHDVMAPASFSAHVTAPGDCATDSGVLVGDIICLSAADRGDPHLNQISSGGPVTLMYEGQIHMLAVVQTIRNYLVMASPIANRYVLHDI